MTSPKQPSEKEQENNPTDNPEGSEKKKEVQEVEDPIDYKALSAAQRAEYDILLQEVEKLKEFKHEVMKAKRKQLVDNVKTMFPDLDISGKESEEYLKGLLDAGVKHGKQIDEDFFMPDKTEPEIPRYNLTEEQKLIKKILDG